MSISTTVIDLEIFSYWSPHSIWSMYKNTDSNLLFCTTSNTKTENLRALLLSYYPVRIAHSLLVEDTVLIWHLIVSIFESLKIWIFEYLKGLPIPPGMLEEALHSRKAFGAIEFQTQLLYSAADQVNGLLNIASLLITSFQCTKFSDLLLFFYTTDFHEPCCLVLHLIVILIPFQEIFTPSSWLQHFMNMTHFLALTTLLVSSFYV